MQLIRKTLSKEIQNPISISSFEKKRKVEAHPYYTQRISELTSTLIGFQKKYRMYTFLRLISFAAAASTFYFFWGSLLLFHFFIFAMALFLLMVRFSVEAKYQRDKILSLIEINENEIEVLKGNWSMFEDGFQYRSGKHSFSLDMDIFGKKSVFQLLNRTVSSQGNKKLADTLLNGSKRKEINAVCIAELSKQMTWCQEFIAEGIVRSKEGMKEPSLVSLQEIQFSVRTFVKIARYVLPIAAISAVLLMASDFMPVSVFSMCLLLILSIVGMKVKVSNRIAHQLTAQSNRVKTVLKQLELYGKLETHSSIFKEEQDSLMNSEKGVLGAVRELDILMGRFDTRSNFLMGITLNYFLAWDFQLLVQMKKWVDQYRDQLPLWEEKLSDLEVWISGAVFKHNYPQSTIADMKSENKEVKIIQLSHPFVAPSKSVANDVTISVEENFMIITGPNMAGKSTYLRSLGLTFVFANAGFPVLAKECSLPPLKLFTSMRTSDDLTVESSYFHAELTRLRFIMDAIEQGEQVFIILDEILKGTNSKDKEIGSARFLQKLQRLGAKGVIATHDLSLCELAKDSTAFHNRFFDSTIAGETLSFDYKIREGVCQNMNASFLLKQMQLVD